MTSVKDFEIDTEPTATTLGRGTFVFSDRYSVFDWGEMPDHIPDKGASLCTMGAHSFERLEAADVPTHYRGVEVDGVTRALDDVEIPPRRMTIDLTRVPPLPYEDGEYDYDAYYQAVGEHYLIPLEIVFRNTVPIGSSLRRRTEPADHGLGMAEWPDEPVELTEPIVEFSTKYEASDRYLDRSEADRIAGPAPLGELEAVARSVNRVVTDRAEDAGFVHQDGKIECLYVDGEIRVGDVVGTFDENRFAYDGQQVSKEVLRQYYKHTQPEWVEAVAEAKQAAKDQDVEDWKTLCSVTPDGLPDAVLTAARDLYAAGANAYIGRSLFEAPPIDTAVDRVREL
ncbi:MAG: phosphoribosylaminoimidazolesuccinocarboxamide synthase [Halobacteriales archaeon]|nr:phosphoribosylaminoimidazolesuccinocarboxamide synthase [Halobacteriales archaeon]